ncbi:DedA family protein [bacterium]|nr:DedA family protein [bacterium]
MRVLEGGNDIADFLHLITSSNALWLYSVLLVSAIVENLFPPYPGDTVIIIGGYLVGVGKLNLSGALLSSTAGSLVGASLLFLLGLTKGRTLFHRGRYPFFSPERLRRVEGWFEQHGRKVVLASRFLAGVRSIVAISAGIGRMRYGTFLVFSLVSILAWNGLLLYLGLKLGQNWERIVDLFRFYNGLIVALVGLFVLVWYLKRRYTRRS